MQGTYYLDADKTFHDQNTDLQNILGWFDVSKAGKRKKKVIQLSREVTTLN